ncbi:hypothetical protein ab3b_01734 [Weissella cibaria]|uniref:Uncharacterized protein n=1 Tax=Weissella cibaria TaxID=137591 RepID=A0A0D1LQG3_9LACO|nr:hypothetical protein ab3b_01734 [Weissella cibaria]
MRSKILISTTLVTTVLAAGLIGAKLGSNSLKTKPATSHRTSSEKQVNNPPVSSPATKQSSVASTSSPWSANKSQQLAIGQVKWVNTTSHITLVMILIYTVSYSQHPSRTVP